jgi:hypothetical protein
VGGVARADEAGPTLRGGWVATAGTSAGASAGALRGRWTADMLTATAARQITGSWRMGGARGRWWLKG